MASGSDASVVIKTKKPDVVPDNDKKVDGIFEAETSSKTDLNELPANKSEIHEKSFVAESGKQTAGVHTKKEAQPECSTSKSNTTSDEKYHSNLKTTHVDPKLNAHDTTLPFSSETFTVTSDSQIWLECCQYNNTFRAYGGNFRNFHPNSSKLNNNQVPSSNHHYSSQGTSSCPQIHRGNNANSMNYNRNSQYVVHLHVNPGETISFDMGDHVQLIQGILKFIAYFFLKQS